MAIVAGIFFLLAGLAWIAFPGVLTDMQKKRPWPKRFDGWIGRLGGAMYLAMAVAFFLSA